MRHLELFAQTDDRTYGPDKATSTQIDCAVDAQICVVRIKRNRTLVLWRRAIY